MRAVTFFNTATIVLTFAVLAASLAPVQPVGIGAATMVAADATTARAFA